MVIEDILYNTLHIYIYIKCIIQYKKSQVLCCTLFVESAYYSHKMHFCKPELSTFFPHSNREVLLGSVCCMVQCIWTTHPSVFFHPVLPLSVTLCQPSQFVWLSSAFHSLYTGSTSPVLTERWKGMSNNTVEHVLVSLFQLWEQRFSEGTSISVSCLSCSSMNRLQKEL